MILNKQIILAMIIILTTFNFALAGPIVPEANQHKDTGVIEVANLAYDWSAWTSNNSITFKDHYTLCMRAALDFVEFGIRCQFAGKYYFAQRPQGDLKIIINGEVEVVENISGVSAKRRCQSISEVASVDDLVICRFKDRLIYTNQFELPDWQPQQ